MDREENRSQKKIAIFLLILFINLILISNSVVLKNNKSILQNTLHLIAYPFQSLFLKGSDFITSRLNSYVFLKNTYKKFITMKKKQSALIYENYLLKKELNNFNFSKKVREKYNQLLTADVLSIDSGFPYSGAIINKGYFSGIKKNMVVVNDKMELVGKIVEPISMFSSKVRFITNPIGGVGAYIEKNKLEGLLRGNNTNICSFNYLIENKPVEEGDIVVTSGTDEIFPPYLKIGVVIRTEKKVLIQNVVVKPYFTGKSIKKLIVITNE
ncbi:MAG: rod shape-determining protein MreC [Acidobacteriota bacterium]